MRKIVLAVLLLTAAQLSAALSVRERNARIHLLPAAAQEFLYDVTPIITDIELDSFLTLQSDAQREVFIREFWRRRDVAQGTTNHAFKDLYYERLELVKPELEPVSSDRARTFLLHGEPEGRIPIRCESQFRPIEIWKYAYIPSLGRDVRFVFFKPRHRDEFIMWLPPTHRTSDLRADMTSAEVGSLGSVGNPGQCMHGEELTGAIASILQNVQRLQTVLVPPEIVKAEADVNKLLDSFVLSKPDPKAATIATRTLSRRERKERLAAVSEAHRKFLDEVAPIINDSERDVFVLMETETQRDRFIEEFWKGRDKVNGLTNGAYKDAY